MWPLLAFVLVPLLGAAAGGAGRVRAAAWLLIAPTMVWAIWHHNISWVHYVAILLGCGMALAMHSGLTFRLFAPLSSRVVQVALAFGIYYVQNHSMRAHRRGGADSPR